jgi:hypothetical protein
VRPCLLFFRLVVEARILPVRLGDPINLIAPATNADGSVVLFGAAVAPDGGCFGKVTNIYTMYDVNALLASELLSRLGRAGQHGATWHYARPPIVSIECAKWTCAAASGSRTSS